MRAIASFMLLAAILASADKADSQTIYAEYSVETADRLIEINPIEDTRFFDHAARQEDRIRAAA